jgi:hypothetical protein
MHCRVARICFRGFTPPHPIPPFAPLPFLPSPPFLASFPSPPSFPFPPLYHGGPGVLPAEKIIEIGDARR